MTKKKTPTPVKKDTSEQRVSEGEWKHFLHTMGHSNSASSATVFPPVGETRVSELEAENYALKTLLSKHQSEPMQQGKPIQEQRITMLSQFAEALDGQLSRLYNSINTLDAISNRLVIQKEEGIVANTPEPHDLSTRLSNLISYFSQQNDRLDILNAKLSDLI